jgi:hypothetical protein
MLPRLLEALEFRSNNTAYWPVIDAIGLLKRYAGRPGQKQHYDPAEVVPLDDVVPREWREAVVTSGAGWSASPTSCASSRRCVRPSAAGRCGWSEPTAGATPKRTSLPTSIRAAIRQPIDPTAFIAEIQRRIREALTRLNKALVEGTTGGVRITRRRGEPWIRVPAPDKQPEAPNL